LCLEVDRLVRSGVVVVVAAGNTGSGTVKTLMGAYNTVLEGSINDPGNAELAITVGSTHRDMPQKYGVSYFSSKGPTADGRKKPDILAPGQDIVCCSTGRMKAESGKAHDDAIYLETSGTSFATAVASGAVAVLLSGRRELIGQPEVLKRLFLETATDLQRSEFYQGHGLINLMKAFGGPAAELTPPVSAVSAERLPLRETSLVRRESSGMRADAESDRDAAKTYRSMCSYSHKDEQLWEELKDHLSPLQRQGLLKLWYDRCIAPGAEWENEIFEELKNADIIILLVSAAFIASDFCFKDELANAIERHKAGQCRVIPIIVRHVDWKNMPFARLQALPKDGKPVTSYTRQDEAWLQVAEGIRLIVEKFDSDRKVSRNR
jgi:Subtilase family/TIR domain